MTTFRIPRVAAAVLVTATTLAAQFDDLRAEANREALVERIKEQMHAIDDALLDAGEAESIREHLAGVKESHRGVIRDIEELIQSVKYQRSNSSSSSGAPQQQQQQQQQGQQPQPQPRDADQRQPQSDSDPNQRIEDGTRPEDAPQSADAQPEERPNTGLPPQETGDFLREDLDGRWGLLPPKLQERLMNLHVDDVPERYRQWLEAYTRAVHSSEDR